MWISELFQTILSIAIVLWFILFVYAGIKKITMKDAWEQWMAFIFGDNNE